MGKPKNLKTILEVSAAVLGIIGAVIGMTNDLWDIEDKKNEEMSHDQAVASIGDLDDDSVSSTIRVSDDGNIVSEIQENNSNNTIVDDGNDPQVNSVQDSEKEPSSNNENSINGTTNGVNSDNGNTSPEVPSENETVVSTSVSVEKVDSNVICACVTNEGYAYLTTDSKIYMSDGSIIDAVDLGYSSRQLEWNSRAILLFNPNDNQVYLINRTNSSIDAYRIVEGAIEQVYKGDSSEAIYSGEVYYDYFLPNGELLMEYNRIYDLDAQLCMVYHGDYHSGWIINDKYFSYTFDKGYENMESGEIIARLDDYPDGEAFYNNQLFWVYNEKIWCFNGETVTELLDLSNQSSLMNTKCKRFYAGESGFIWIDSNNRMFYISAITGS